MNFTRPVPSLRHPDGGSRNGGSFGAQYARAEGNRNSRRMGADGGAFLIVEAAFGSDEEGCGRSDARRGGEACVRTCIARWSPYHEKTKTTNAAITKHRE